MKKTYEQAKQADEKFQRIYAAMDEVGEELRAVADERRRERDAGGKRPVTPWWRDSVERVVRQAHSIGRKDPALRALLAMGMEAEARARAVQILNLAIREHNARFLSPSARRKIVAMVTGRALEANGDAAPRPEEKRPEKFALYFDRNETAKANVLMRKLCEKLNTTREDITLRALEMMAAWHEVDGYKLEEIT